MERIVFVNIPVMRLSYTVYLIEQVVASYDISALKTIELYDNLLEYSNP